MARELKKKILRHDSPAESQAEEAGEREPGGDRKAPRHEEAEVDGRAAFEAEADSALARSDPDRAQEPEGGPVPEGSLEPPTSPGKRWVKALAVVGTPVLLLVVVIAALLLLKFSANSKFFEKPAPKLERLTSVKRPIPVPDYREMLDFLVLDSSESQKTLTMLRIEVGFRRPSTYQNFKDQNVLFRDTVYSFLKGQNASRNTSRSWQTVIEKDLFDYMRAMLPESSVDTIRLTQVENL